MYIYRCVYTCAHTQTIYTLSSSVVSQTTQERLLHTNTTYPVCLSHAQTGIVHWQAMSPARLLLLPYNPCCKRHRCSLAFIQARHLPSPYASTFSAST